MYPKPLIWDIDLYIIFIALGIAACFFVYRFVSDRIGVKTKIFNFTLLLAVAAIAFGIFSSILFQAVFDALKTGVFVINKNSGATFAGGLIGGAAVFIAGYFIFGRLVSDEYRTEFRKVMNAAACAIPTAHSLGRVGCLMAGCCYGKPTDSFIGIYMESAGTKVIPTQLFEAVFLAALAAFLIVRTLKKKDYALSFYMVLYGIWRFFIEFVRDDDRGKSLTGLLSPSQEISILLFIGGIVLFVLLLNSDRKKAGGKE